MSDFPYGDIIILALAAIFVLLQLRRVLGRKFGDDLFLKGPQPTERRDFQPDHIIQLDEKSLKAKPKEEADTYFLSLPEGPVADTLRQIKTKDPQFVATHFMQGARAAFEMVFDAFVKGDKQTLRMLMSDTIYQHFNRDLEVRAKQQNKTETTLVSVAAKEISQATLERNMARLTVHFESEQVTLVRGPKGEIIEGNPSELHHVEDQWVFERDITSKNPNWKIIET